MQETEKFPTRIQKLFAPKLPLVYVPPIDYPIEKRRTNNVSPISSWKSQYSEYIKELPAIEAAHPTKQSDRQIKHAAAKARRVKLEESLANQLDEWNKDENPMTTSTYNTVFILRLDYTLSELDVSQVFTKYGIVESIRIVRDKNGKSRGYAFVVFEREADALNCVHELARTGVKFKTEAGESNRTSLVDIERGRVVRNWKPRRLGGGLGGRHYTKPGSLNVVASAAATGRRLNIPSHTPVERKQYIPPAPSRPLSVRDKYAKYSSVPERSIRSIREGKTS